MRNPSQALERKMPRQDQNQSGALLNGGLRASSYLDTDPLYARRASPADPLD